MRNTITWCMVGLLLISGCVPSLNAIYTDRDLVFDETFVGMWGLKNSPGTWDLQQRDAKSYRLTQTDREGRTGSYIAHLAEVEGTRFLDLLPEQTDDAKPSLYRVHHVPIHTIYLVKETGDNTVLAAIDGKWLETYLTDNPATDPSVTIGASRMLTGSTESIQRFLLDNKAQFKHELNLERVTTAAVQ